jgi:hypothetical protein
VPKEKPGRVGLLISTHPHMQIWRLQSIAKTQTMQKVLKGKVQLEKRENNG